MARILIVDDSGMSRRTLRKILEPAGHQVTEASDGMSALEQFFVDRPNLVLLDLTMSGMYGIDVLKKLQEIDPEVRVVVASADIQTSTRAMVEEAGAAAFINKPFDVDRVLKAVSAALKENASGTE
jgi:two-component system, chemotaxis family, chemotaxis protein CheY